MKLLFPCGLTTKYKGAKDLPELLQLYFKHIQTLLDRGKHSLEYLKAHINETAEQVEKDWLRRYVRLINCLLLTLI